jgi:hypothetical protein
MLGNKVGWMSDSLSVDKTDHGDVVTVREEGEMRVIMFGAETRMEMSSTYVYRLSGDGMLIRAEEKTLDGDSASSSTAEAIDGGYAVTLISEEQKRKLRTGSSKDTLRLRCELDHWLKQNPKPGDQLRQYTFDFDKLSNAAVGADRVDPDEEETLAFVNSRGARWSGVPVTVAEVNVSMEFFSGKMELLPDGTPLSFSVGPMIARLEEDVFAKDFELVVADMLSMVPIEDDLGPPDKVKRTVIELSELGEFQVPQTSRQRILKARPGYALLDIQKGRWTDDPQPLSDEDMRTYLSATLRLPADNQRIVKLARKIVRGETDPVRQADRLQEWIHMNIEGSYSKNAETALRVLDNEAGDCTELALLFVSLARSLKIPSRELGGLMFSNEPAPGFYWHAWAEIHDGQRWIGVDPSFNEVGIDATHIKMSERPSDWRWMQVLGHLKIRVRDFETD